MLLLRLLLLVVLLPTAAFAATPDRRIAITIDDLPWQRIELTPAAELPARHAQLIAALKQAGTPGVGFVNEGKLEVDGQVRPERVAMLHDWLEAGYELGNHTYGHVDLHAVGLDAYQADILRGERQLRPLLAERGRTPRWFRHPYLRAGRTAGGQGGGGHVPGRTRLPHRTGDGGQRRMGVGVRLCTRARR